MIIGRDVGTYGAPRALICASSPDEGSSPGAEFGEEHHTVKRDHLRHQEWDTGRGTYGEIRTFGEGLEAGL